MSQVTELHGTSESLADHVAANVRAEMAAQRKTTAELATVLHLGHRAATRRWNGEQHFALSELPVVARWLGVTVSSLMAFRSLEAVSA